MEIVNNLGLMIGLASAVFGAGISVGIFTNKYMTRDKCDELRKECSNNFECKISHSSTKLEDITSNNTQHFEDLLLKLESQIKESFRRVHARLDEYEKTFHRFHERISKNEDSVIFIRENLIK